MGRRQSVIARDGLACRYCGAILQEAQAVLDHVQPRSRGGSDGIRNRVVACRPCDSRKGSRTLTELGWELRPPAPHRQRVTMPQTTEAFERRLAAAERWNRGIRRAA